MYSKVFLIGNVGRDPEVKALPSGTRLATFPLATNDRRKDQNGQWVDHTEWHNIVVWARLAEIVEQYVQKGRQLFIEGQIRTRSWEQDGQKKYMTEIHARELKLLGGGGGGGGGGARSGPSQDYDSGGFPDDGDDVPF